jgi:L-iditol 2-dehydrogenase
VTEMRALVVDAPGAAAVRTLPVPEAGPGEVLVRVGAAGICGSDLELLDGRRPAGYVRYPIVPGHEWAGRVAAVGPGVTGLAEGVVVVAEGFRACGGCDRCKEGRTNLCLADYAETGFTHAGAFAEFLSVPAPLVHRLPDGTDLAAAALLEPAACVAEGLLECELRPGLSVAVVGAGTLGLLAVALLRRTSPARLALVGSRSPRLELGRSLGASEIVDIRAADAGRPSTSCSRPQAMRPVRRPRLHSRGAAAPSSSKGSLDRPEAPTPTRSSSATCACRGSSARPAGRGAG